LCISILIVGITVLFALVCMGQDALDAQLLATLAAFCLDHALQVA
jgi:hypothetical protein